MADCSQFMSRRSGRASQAAVCVMLPDSTSTAQPAQIKPEQTLPSTSMPCHPVRLLLPGQAALDSKQQPAQHLHRDRTVTKGLD